MRPERHIVGWVAINTREDKTDLLKYNKVVICTYDSFYYEYYFEIHYLHCLKMEGIYTNQQQFFLVAPALTIPADFNWNSFFFFIMLLTTALFASYFFSIFGKISVNFSDILLKAAATFSPVLALTKYNFIPFSLQNAYT